MSSSTPILLGICNPLLDISAPVAPELLTKYAPVLLLSFFLRLSSELCFDLSISKHYTSPKLRTSEEYRIVLAPIF
jgi:hypothetical protein